MAAVKGFPFCTNCSGYHGKLPSVGAMLLDNGPKICRICRGKAWHPPRSNSCTAQAESTRMCELGLISTRRGWIEANTSTKRVGSIRYASTSGAKHAHAALKRFNERAELVPSNYNSRTNRLECWTDKSGMDTLLLIQWAARSLDGGTGLSVPEMARRLAQHPDLFAEFRASYHLGASDMDLLVILYKPILKGPEFKKRPSSAQ